MRYIFPIINAIISFTITVGCIFSFGGVFSIPTPDSFGSVLSLIVLALLSIIWFAYSLDQLFNSQHKKPTIKKPTEEPQQNKQLDDWGLPMRSTWESSTTTTTTFAPPEIEALEKAKDDVVEPKNTNNVVDISSHKDFKSPK